MIRDFTLPFMSIVAFWNRIAGETGVNQAIHFEDHPQLKNFDCPEWSHLTQTDSTAFTRHLVGMIKR